LKEISEYSYMKIADVKSQYKNNSPQNLLMSKNSVNSFSFLKRDNMDPREKNEMIYYTAPMLGFLETNGFLIHQMQVIYHKNDIVNQDTKEKEWAKYGEIAKENHSKLKATIRKFGIVAKKRPLVWYHISGADKKQKENEDLYQSLTKIYESLNNYSDANSESLARDIPMTFPDHPLFTEPTNAFKKIHRILVNYPGFNQNFTYFTEATKIIGILLIHFPREESAFWMFSTLMESILPPKYYDTKFSGLMLEVSVTEKLIEAICPKIFHHLETMKISPSYLLEKWYKKLYLEYLPIESTMRIWDLLFSEGFDIIHRIAIAIFQMNERVILETQGADLIHLLENMPHTCFNIDKLIDISLNLPVKHYTSKNIEKIRKKNEPTVNKEIMRNLFLGRYPTSDAYGPDWVREDHEFKELLQNDKNEELFGAFLQEEFHKCNRKKSNSS
jgi:hypothetical protein